MYVVTNMRLVLLGHRKRKAVWEMPNDSSFLETTGLLCLEIKITNLIVLVELAPFTHYNDKVSTGESHTPNRTRNVAPIIGAQ